MSRFSIQQLSGSEYRIIWTPGKTIKKYRFLVGTDPGLDNVYSGATRPGGGGPFTEHVTGGHAMWMQVEYMSTEGEDNTAPQQLP